MKKYIRNTLVALGILGIASAQVTDPFDLIPDPEVSIQEIDHSAGTYKLEQNEKVTIEGDLRVTGGRFEMNKHPLRIKGDFHIGKDAEFVQTDAPIILEGKAHKIVKNAAEYYERAVFSGTTVLHATGSLKTGTGYGFMSYLYVEPILAGTGFELASYSGSDLVPNPEALNFIPQTKSQGSGWSIPFYKPSHTLNHVIIK